ncbi:CYTH domain-containing protein [Bacillus sp. MRMR6]|uniref:CYTH domain-containing protein n=1 Tax=Bacillus sp. MRMR6 TaxID=1928617 RepID=UPI0009528B14|nr:CYTH domain-containing protein [Bacillus sp. MRMR6]OLS41824.1 CYTH domain-containing protein [Bacillus sp. MRMR6]
MSEQIEIEFKNILTKSEYEMFLKEFNISGDQIFTQVNYYFDTPYFDLKNASAALRIRKKAKGYELTLKQPQQLGILETTQALKEGEFISAIESNKLPIGIVHSKITKLGITYSHIEHFGSLTTKRVEIPYRNGLLVFDHSYYLGKEDYEVEYEVENYEDGYNYFLELLTRKNIPNRKTDNKIHRFYQQKYASNK